MLDDCLTPDGFVKGKEGIPDGNTGCYFGSYAALKRFIHEPIKTEHLHNNILNLNPEHSHDEWTGILASCALTNTIYCDLVPIWPQRVGGVSILKKLAKKEPISHFDWLWFIPIILQDIYKRDGSSGTILNFIKISTIMFCTDYPWYMPFKKWKSSVVDMSKYYDIYFGPNHEFTLNSKGIV